MLGHVLEALSFVRVESIILAQTIPQLCSLSLQFFNLGLKLSALSFVVLQLLLLSDFDFFEVKAEVLRHSMELPQYFIFCHNVLHVHADFVILFSEFVEVIIGYGGLVGQFLRVYQQGWVFVFATHFS